MAATAQFTGLGPHCLARSLATRPGQERRVGPREGCLAVKAAWAPEKGGMPSLQGDSGLPDPLLGGHGPQPWSIFRAGSRPEHRGPGKGASRGRRRLTNSSSSARLGWAGLGSSVLRPSSRQLEKKGSPWGGSGACRVRCRPGDRVPDPFSLPPLKAWQF